MGIGDKIDLWLIRRIVKKARKIAITTTETMIESSIAKSLTNQKQGKPIGRSAIISGLIETRPFWEIDIDGNILRKGGSTNKNINTETSMSLVKYVTLLEYTLQYGDDLHGYEQGYTEINDTIEEWFNEHDHLWAKGFLI